MFGGAARSTTAWPPRRRGCWPSVVAVQAPSTEFTMENISLEPLIDALLEGDQTVAVARALDLLGMGVSKERIIGGGIEPAMERLDAKCTLEQFNLLEIMLSGRAALNVRHQCRRSLRPVSRYCQCQRDRPVAEHRRRVDRTGGKHRALRRSGLAACRGALAAAARSNRQDEFCEFGGLCRF